MRPTVHGAVHYFQVRVANGQEMGTKPTGHILGDVECCHGDQKPKEEDGRIAHNLVEERGYDEPATAAVVGVWRQVLHLLSLAVGEYYDFCCDHLYK